MCTYTYIDIHIYKSQHTLVYINTSQHKQPVVYIYTLIYIHTYTNSNIPIYRDVHTCISQPMSGDMMFLREDLSMSAELSSRSAMRPTHT